MQHLTLKGKKKASHTRVCRQSETHMLPCPRKVRGFTAKSLFQTSKALASEVLTCLKYHRLFEQRMISAQGKKKTVTGWQTHFQSRTFTRQRRERRL